MAKRPQFPSVASKLAQVVAVMWGYQESIAEAQPAVAADEFLDIDFNKEIEENLMLVPKAGGLVPFRPWPKQKEMGDLIRQCRREKRACKIVHVKCRQIGSTAYSSAIIFILCMFLLYRNCKIVAHRRGGVARELFRKQEIFYENLPEDKQKPLKGSASGKRGQVNVDRLEYAAPHGSATWMETAGGRAGELGRSGTVQYQVWTEFDWWENQEENFSSAKATIPKKGVTWDTLLIVESTANGQRGLKQLWDEAQEPDSDYIPFFTGIKDDPYAWEEIIPGRKCEDVAKEQDKAAYQVAEEHGFVADALEAEYAERWGVCPELLRWCRTVRKDDCFGSWDYFNQEYPVSPEVAFLFTGLPWYDQAKIQAMIDAAEAEQGAISR